MQKTAQSCIYSVVGGFCIYIVETLFSMLPYMSIPDSFFQILFIVGIVLGVVITTTVLLYKNPTPLQRILRFVILFSSFACVFMLNGYIGTIRTLLKLFSINANAGSDNVSGMLTLTFLSVIVIASIIIMAVTMIIRMCSRSTGDGLREPF